MNIDTNELVTAAEMARMSAAERSRFTPVPEHLSKAAHKALGHSQRVRIPRDCKSPLAKWAAEKRRKRRQMQRESRKANR